MTITVTRGSEVAITVTLNSLGIGAYVDTSAIQPAAADLDHHVRVTIANVAETGNEVIGVSLLASNDGVDYTTSEAHGNTNEVGIIDLGSSTTDVVKVLFVAQAFGGFLPTYYKLRFFNDAGVALAASGNSAEYLPVGLDTI